MSVGTAGGPDADDLRALFGEGMRCAGCGGLGVMTEATPAGGHLWWVTWWTEHRPPCPGVDCPASAYLVDMAALLDGDTELPGVAADPQDRA